MQPSKHLCFKLSSLAAWLYFVFLFAGFFWGGFFWDQILNSGPLFKTVVSS